MKKKILITGATGMTASHAVDLFLEKGWDVSCLVRRTSLDSTARIKHNLDKVTLIQGDLSDTSSIYNAISTVMPDAIFNAAAQSHVHVSFKEASSTFRVTGMGVLDFLEGIRLIKPDCRFITLNSSEMFGNQIDNDGFQRITTPLVPVSPYAVAKLASHHLVRIYRDSYNLFACSAICFNKESERRNVAFFPRKVSKYVGDLVNYIKSGGENFKKLQVGNLDSERDISYSPDCVEGFYAQLMSDKPNDYLFASGTTHKMQEIVDLAFKIGSRELGTELNSKEWVEINPEFIRPNELHKLCGDSTETRKELNWKPKHSFNDIIEKMVLDDINNPNKGY
jgi:GDPmannose 4,6-dehydratase